MKYEKFEEWMIGKKVRHSSGDTVVAKRKDGRNTVVFYVVDEYEDVVKSSGAAYIKSDWVFYKLGEEVKFQ